MALFTLAVPSYWPWLSGCYVVTHQFKVVHYLLLEDELGLVLVDALGFVLVDSLSVVLFDPLVVCNPSCNKLKNYSSINLWIAVQGYEVQDHHNVADCHYMCICVFLLYHRHQTLIS